MGWSEDAEGIVNGDGPAGAVAEAMRHIADEAERRTGKLPTSGALVHSLVHALNHDGTRAPFFHGIRRIEALVANHGSKRVRVEGRRAESWIVGELYSVLDTVSEEYQSAWDRPPTLEEILHYFGPYLNEQELLTEHASDRVPWKFGQAKFVLRKEKKSEDRIPSPKKTTTVAKTKAKATVRHPKFGEGEVVGEEGERLRVRFSDEVRVVLRSFVTSIS